MRVAVCAILTALEVAPLSPQGSAQFQDLLPELAAKIAAILGSGAQISLSTTSEDMTALFTARGLGVVGAAPGITSVGVSCSSNLRERSCQAEVQTTTLRDVVIVTRPHEGTTPGDHRAAVTLELRPLFAQRTQILDAVRVGERLVVLDAQSISLHRQTGQGWQREHSRPLPASRAWPRDLRGRLLVEGNALGVYLPGMACSGILSDLVVECTADRRPWPLGIDNTGMEPARNYFNTPEGLPFYSAALLTGDAGARWLVSERNGALTLLDDGRRPLVRVAAADDVAAVSTACGPESYVVATESADGREAIRLFHVTRQRLVPVGSPVFATGTLTALWSSPGATAATAVTRDASGGRYEAFLATVACGR
jgi:hypothetical protein